MNKNNLQSIIISRTIYDPSIRDFIFDSSEKKALSNIKQWINNHNPVIYWYILKIENPSDLYITQWAVELHTNQALTIKEVYIDGIEHEFKLRRQELDYWNEKYVLSIPEQRGIPIIARGTRRIYFKVDINCNEGLMHEYDISGKFIAKNTKSVEIKKKMFRYSCKVDEFKQIFHNNPDDASMYAQKRLSGRYSKDDVYVFINSFRLIHELSNYCHSESIQKDELNKKLQILNTNFEELPEIGDKRIIPLIHGAICMLDTVNKNKLDKNELVPKFTILCDELVELLHIEVMRTDAKLPEPIIKDGPDIDIMQNKCPNCSNLITESNKSLICSECGTQFCNICEEKFRGGKTRSGMPLCEDCITTEQDNQKWDEIDRRIKKKINQKKKQKQITDGKRLGNERKNKDEMKEYVNSFGMNFVLIPEGEFMMGSKEGEDNEKPVHKVKIYKPFYFGIYPVTQREWIEVIADNPSGFQDDNLLDRPVENVSWDDVQEFIKEINKKEETDKYRLPSEEEWEYATRAGTTTDYCFGDDKSKLTDYAWYNENSDETHSVGKRKPNKFGLYDMHGNVWEWVQDKWHDSNNDLKTDGSAWKSGNSSNRVNRGGSCLTDAKNCRSAYRNNTDPQIRFLDLGFRLIKDIDENIS